MKKKKDKTHEERDREKQQHGNSASDCRELPKRHMNEYQPRASLSARFATLVFPNPILSGAGPTPRSTLILGV